MILLDKLLANRAFFTAAKQHTISKNYYGIYNKINKIKIKNFDFDRFLPQSLPI